MTIRISNKGWVVIPSELRKKYNLKPGDEVKVIDYGGVFAIVPVLQNPIDGSAGMLSGDGRSLIQALLEEHRREMESE